MRTLVSISVLAALLVQSLFVSLPGSVVICLGGGHHHAAEACPPPPTAKATAPPAACCSGCSHEDTWPAPPTDDHHDDRCACTDIELALIDLQFTAGDSTPQLVQVRIAPPFMWATVGALSNQADQPRAKPPNWAPHDHAARHTLAVARAVVMRT